MLASIAKWIRSPFAKRVNVNNDTRYRDQNGFIPRDYNRY